jgi:hypothetical protein
MFINGLKLNGTRMEVVVVREVKVWKFTSCQATLGNCW